MTAYLPLAFIALLAARGVASLWKARRLRHAARARLAKGQTNLW